MKPLLFSVFLLLLFFSSLGQVFNEQVHLDLVKSSPNVNKAEGRENRSLQESQQLKPDLGLPWMLVYVPVRSCHRVLKEKLGEFSPPTYNPFQLNIWCNWTIWAGSRKHIIIYIKGFMTNEDCDTNDDKILFHGVSSLVENTVIYACWNKNIHVFATYARAVHVVFLMKYSSNPRNKYFKGKYYIFKHRDIDSSSDNILVSQAPIPTSKKTSHSTPRSNKVSVIYHGEISDDTNISTALSTENLNKNLNKTTVLNNTGLLQVGGEGQNVEVLESSLQLIPQHDAKSQLLKTEAHSLLESLTLSTSVDKEKNLGIGKSFGSLPQTAAPDIWELRPAECEEVLVDFSQVYRPKSLSGFLSETSYLSVSHLTEPLKSMELEGPESRMSFLLTSLRQTNMGDLQLNINPTPLSYPVLASYLHSVAHDRVETVGDKNIGSTPSQSLSRVTLVNDGLLQPNIVACMVASSPSDRLVKGSLHSLRMTSQDQVVLDQSQPETRGMDKAGSYQISSTQRISGEKSVTELDLRTILKNINPLDVSVLESSMEVTDQPKIMLVTAAPYGLLDSEYHLRLQSSQHVDSASTELESILPSTEGSLHQAAKVNVSEVFHLGMKSSQQVGLVMELEPIPSTEVSLPPAASELELLPSIETSLPVFLTELEPVIPVPHTEPSLSPAASELSPILFPSTEVSLPVFPTEMGPVTSALEPVTPFPSTDPSLSPAASDLGPVLFPDTEVIFSLAAIELEPIIPSKEASLPPAAQRASALGNELHLRTKSSHYTDTDTELDHINLSTRVLLPPAVEKDLLEGKPQSKPHSDCYGAPAATEHRHALPSTTQSLKFFLQERKISVQQSILKGERESIHEAETAQPGKSGERTLITDFIAGTFFSDTTQLQALKPEPELELLGSEGHTIKLSPVTEYLAKTPLVGTRTNRVKQNELIFKNGLMASSTRATPPLEHIAMNNKVKMTTEPVKEMSNTPLKHTFPDTTKHHKVQQTTEWSSASQSSATASSNALTPAEELAPKESIDSHSFQSSSTHAPENASTSEARVLLNYIVPELPWLLLYLPIRSCHVTLKDKIGTFSPPAHSGIQTNIWCNWTIWAGPQKHILIYVKGFQGKDNCDENPDKIIFQGVSSSVERKVVYACKNQGTLIFATQALAVHVVFLSKGNSLNHERKYFKGQYYVFKDYETSRSTNDTQEPVQKTTRKTKYGSIRFYPKSPIKHYRGLLDFVKTSTARNENQLLNKLPTVDKEGWDKNGSSTRLEAFLRFVLENNTHIPLLKDMDMTFSTRDLKWQQFMKSLGNENSSRKSEGFSSLMVTPALNILRLNIQNKKEQTIAFGKLMHRPTIHSNLLSETLHLKEPMKSVAMQSVKTTKSVGPQHSSILAELQSVAEDLQPDRNSTPHRGLNALLFPCAPQRLQTTSSQSFRAALIKEGEVLQSNSVNNERVASHPAAFVEDFQSNARLSRDGQEIISQLKHVMNSERSIKDHHIEHQTHRKGNGTGDLYTKPASALKNVKLNVEPLTLGMPKKALETESIMVTVAPHNTLDVSSSYHAETTATEFKPVLPSSTRSSPLGKTAAASAHLGTPVTQDQEPPLILGTQLHPSYPSSGGVSKDTASLKTEHEKDSFDLASIFTSLENDTMLESQHNPGDVLFEVTSEIEHKGWIPHSGDELKKALMESIKLHIQKNLKLLINKVNEIKLKEIKRTNDLKPTFTFWLHLKSEERNMSVLLHSQLNDLIGKPVEAEKLQMALLSVRDVNECNSGIGMCGDEADCLNEDGTYLCRCKKGYEDRSRMKSGTLCVRIPQSGIGGFFSYMEILVGTTVFFIFILVVVASSLCTILRKRPTKKDSCIEEPVASGTPSVQSQLPASSIDLSTLGDHLILDPFRPKLRAKPPEWTSQVRSNPTETYRISIEQSERL
ncbi:uncharacterized protein LOC119853566 isoform X2 [Dermochelys coriacea]|uniref:uncharacterized protein LOC119853566 isoform X2 n=1 Tax=Dermochelys coriacea TaxID=27794 RepID=UPI0018E745B0|nr:uncharacterized protein LOC119853566 isoform X2 [Dermochelys coriacea]